MIRIASFVAKVKTLRLREPQGVCGSGGGGA
jgi:hypothetical protein